MKTNFKLIFYWGILLFFLTSIPSKQVLAQEREILEEIKKDSINNIDEIFSKYQGLQYQPVEFGENETLEGDEAFLISERPENLRQNRHSEQTILFYIFSFVLLLYGFVRWQFEELLYIGPRILGNVRMMENYYEEPVSHALIPRVLLSINTIIVFGLLAFFVLKNLIFAQLEVPVWLLILESLGIVVLFLLLKAGIQRVLALILPEKRPIELYLFNRRYVHWLLGLILLPILVLMAFTGIIPMLWLMILAGLSVLILGLWQYARGFQLSQHLLKLYPFHFFLYFCTLEIAPILILLGMINRFS